jgi:hypothetical protein
MRLPLMAIVIAGIRKEILSFEYDGTVVKEPLKALVNEWIVHKGVYHNPS